MSQPQIVLHGIQAGSCGDAGVSRFSRGNEPIAIIQSKPVTNCVPDEENACWFTITREHRPCPRFDLDDEDVAGAFSNLNPVCGTRLDLKGRECRLTKVDATLIRRSIRELE